MKPTIAIAACALSITVLCGPARAGVVIDEQVTTSQGSQPPVTRTLQEMVQGHKRKIVRENNAIVIDLDKRIIRIIDPSKKMYAEQPLPPPGTTRKYQPDLIFQKTGKHFNPLDYPCDEYSGTAKTTTVEVSAHGCFSTSAPGSADYDEFNRAAKEMAPKMPNGIPMTLVFKSTLNAGFSMPGLSPDQVAKLKELMAQRNPQTTNKVVTKITMRDLPDDTFAAPAGYQRGSFGATPGTPPSGAGASQAPSAKMPE